MEANGNGDFATQHPSSDPLNGVLRGGFRISTRKRPILKARPIEEMESKLGITVPEMIFGDNVVAIEHVQSGWFINFNTFDALDRVDKVGKSMLQVAHSKEWQDSRYVGCKDLCLSEHSDTLQARPA